jgi:hypothetical protein
VGIHLRDKALTLSLESEDVRHTVGWMASVDKESDGIEGLTLSSKTKMRKGYLYECAELVSEVRTKALRPPHAL